MSRHTDAAKRGVVLPVGHTGSSLFRLVLEETAAEFPETFHGLRLPEQAEFKRRYAELLPELEACRVASPQRVEIARFMVQRTQDRLRFAEPGRELPLGDYLASGEAPPELVGTRLGDDPMLRAEVPFGDRVYRGREIIGLVEHFFERHEVTQAALSALRWIVEHIEAQDGVLDLRGQRFALMGAGAELALTPLLLRGGASVLWVDLSDPRQALAQMGPVAGSLLHAPGARDLLQQPRAITAAIDRWAHDEGPVHIGMFAYAPGASQEWRLCATMNAITRHLQPTNVRSVSVLISPTTPASLQPDSIAGQAQRLAEAPWWQAAATRMGLLERPGHCEHDAARVARALVSIQGLSYQAAQYISKMAAAETFAMYGTSAAADGTDPVTVSANVAGITRTRSISHPLFEAAFIGAPQFGVRIFDVATTRALNGLLILHDLLNPQAPGAGRNHSDDVRAKAAGIFSQQVHGGIYSMPCVLEHAIRLAALIGIGVRPSVLLGGRSARQVAVPT